MFEISVTSKFSAAHNLRNYGGACENLHGHTWKVEVSVLGDNLDEIGLLVDFKLVKKELNKIMDRLDHKYINKEEPFDKINPTAENIAKFIYEELKPKFNISKVSVWESENTKASFFI